MEDIQRLIQDLQSDNPGKRFHACNQIFYALRIPEYAIEELRKATQDSDPLVANAAQRALDVHTETATIPHFQIEKEYSPNPVTESHQIFLMAWAGIVSVIISILISYLILNSSFLEIDSVFGEVPVCLLFTLIPAFLTALLGFGFIFQKWNTPDSQIGVGYRIELISTSFGVISGIVWQLILFLLYSILGLIALKQ